MIQGLHFFYPQEDTWMIQATLVAFQMGEMVGQYGSLELKPISEAPKLQLEELPRESQ